MVGTDDVVVMACVGCNVLCTWFWVPGRASNFAVSSKSTAVDLLGVSWPGEMLSMSDFVG